MVHLDTQDLKILPKYCPQIQGIDIVAVCMLLITGQNISNIIPGEIFNNIIGPDLFHYI